MNRPALGSLHHVELWVPDLPRAITQWGWLLGHLGYVQFQDWPHGRSWRLGSTYLVIEQSPALAAEGLAHGWTLLFPDTHPHAGGPGHYAAYLASTDGFEVELVAEET